MARVRTGWPARIMRALLLSLVAVLVVSLGTVVAVRDEPDAPEPPSRSETALSNARADTQALQQRTKDLAPMYKDDGDISRVLSTVAQTLQRHERMLNPASSTSTVGSAASPSTTTTPASAAEPAAGTPASTAAPEPTAATGAPTAGPSGPATTTGKPQPALPSLVQAMARSGRSALEDAVDTKPAVARMLALAGTEQLTAAHALAAAAGLPQPQLPDAPDGPERTKPPKCGAQTAAASKPTPSGPVAPKAEARALRTTLTGLQRAIYAYETAASRLSGEAASFATDRLRHYRRTLETATQLLESICGRVPVAEPAYLLPQSFRNAPATGLAAVEADLVEMYTDLTGLSDGAVRQWAIGLLPRTSLAARHWEQP